MADSAARLVDEVLPEKPIQQLVLSVPFQLYFLFAAQPEVMSKVLAIVHRVISNFLIERAGLTVKSGAQTGAVTLIQRFGSALNLNLHYHMLYLDGVYNKHAVFYSVKPLTSYDLDEVAQKIAAGVSRYLEKAGYLIRDAESECLDLYSDAEDAMSSTVGASISYRMAFGPNAGKKTLTLQTLPETFESGNSNEQAIQRKKLERVCRYITRPAIAEQRLSLTGLTVMSLLSLSHLILSTMEFIGRLVLRVPKPKGHGMSWAQRLKRVITGRPFA
jgi:hypothetical protein